MAENGIDLMFEGFLQKRKDTMKMWVTYWFRLQNTTLFFYTKKNGSASHLRGSYYIYAMQSVREVHKTDSKRFMFEIVMTNGKRKLLAAETVALRQAWVEHLWQAMQLSSSRVSYSRGTHVQVSEQPGGTDTSHSDPVEESPSPRPLSASTGHILPESQSTSCPSSLLEELNSEETAYQGDQSLPLANVDEAEGEYDVLPARKMEDLYDVPVSFSRASVQSENMYDVPSYLRRIPPDRNSAFSSEEQQEDRRTSLRT